MCQNELTPEILKLDFIDFDREFGDFLLRFTRKELPELAVAGMLTAYELRSGNPILDLTGYAGKTIALDDEKKILLPNAASWKETLLQSQAAALPDSDLRTPLLFTGEYLLMLRRYAGYANNVRQKLFALRRYNRELQMPDVANSDLDLLQHLAVFSGVNSRLLILSGGPGTGKTTVCGHIIRNRLAQNPDMKILFAAPTGKAQQNLAGQIRAAGSDLPESSLLRQAIERVKGATLHSFVLNPQWRTELEYCDLLIIDECSMISLEMFSKLLDILPPATSLILAGDRRQLTSIESGSVFSDLCSFGKVNQLPEFAADFLQSNSDIAVEFTGKEDDFSGHIVELQRNFRSASAPSICRIAAMLRENSLPDETLSAMISATQEEDFRFRTVANSELDSALRERCADLKNLPQLCRSKDPAQFAQALKIVESSKFICTVNQGDRGTAEINNWMLKELNILPTRTGEWLPGTVLLVTANDRQSGLRNGDIGIVTLEQLSSEMPSQRFVRFVSCPEKRFPLSEVPSHECGFAISVHRAQGSGYAKVTFLLPGYKSKVLCRELLYTGITRAATSIELWGPPEEVLFALTHSKERSSNLFKHT